MHPFHRQESSSLGRAALPLTWGLATAAVAAAAVAVTDDVEAADETWAAGAWVAGCSCAVDAAVGAVVVAAAVVSWCSDIAKKNLSCPFLGHGGKGSRTQDKRDMTRLSLNEQDKWSIRRRSYVFLFAADPRGWWMMEKTR